MPRPSEFFAPVAPHWQHALMGTRLASFRERAFALLLDSIVVFAAAAALGASSDSAHAITLPLGASVELDNLYGAGLSTAYFTLATFWSNGRTVGKVVFRIRVVSLVGERISFWHCLDRAIGYAVSSVVAGFGFIQYFTRPNHQTIHDRIAQTIVIRDRSRAAPVMSPGHDHNREEKR